MIIATPPDDSSDPGVARLYAEDLADSGLIFAHTRAMAVNPEAYAAFEQLVRTLVPSVGPRIYEIATLAAARAVGSPHCVLAHTRRAIEIGALTPDEAEGLGDALSPAEREVVRFAERLSLRPTDMDDDDTARLRAAGYSDRQIVDIALIAGARNHFSRALQALAVPVDEVPRLDPALADRLLSRLPEASAR
ncbi:carboxymuconolactone decarboxylase family protein [Microbacterium sp. NPDC091313]